MRHLVIPDTQITPDSDTEHIKWAAQYAVDKKPDVIIVIGDWFDMESLSSYDVGRMSFEGRAYTKDIEAGVEALKRFVAIINTESTRVYRNKKKAWFPRLIFTLGNHEDRIDRAVECDRKLEGLMSLDDLRLNEMGFEVYPFLEVAIVDGIAYSHFFTSGIMQRPVSSARLMLNKKHMSCVMGHVQDKDIAYARRADGTALVGLFCGIFYQEFKDYLGLQNNNSWRGIWLLNDVCDGSFDELPISLKYLKEKYG